MQESLTNARKHAPGQPVSIRLAHASKDAHDAESGEGRAPSRGGGAPLLTVRNPLAGPLDELAGTGGGYGLVGIQERARLLGGTARVDTVDDRFVLTVQVPTKGPLR